jgi:hypothetical protein
MIITTTPRLRELSTTPSSIFPFAKSNVAEAALVAEYIKYNFENWDGANSPSKDPEQSSLLPSLKA